MKKIAILIISTLTIIAHSQKKTDYSFGKITDQEATLKRYERDTTANVLVLYESGNTSFKVGHKNIIISTTYYFKIKLFKKEGFKHATFTIPLYFNKSKREKLIDIKGVTHNYFEKTFLAKSLIYDEKINENWREVKFTMPNLKEGSIVEVEYTLESPFKFNLTGWKFQSDIPKKFSQFKATVPGNYVYNRKLNGYLKLKTNSSTIKKRCFNVPGYSGLADCEVMLYEMEHVPAFLKEDFMTAETNFISKINFELAEIKWFDGTVRKYTTTWKSVDKEFKTDKNIGVQLKKKKYFREKLPKAIDSLTNDLEKAKAVYRFIQNHFNWNKKYGIFKNVRVKNAFENKVGNVGEINISLINALKAFGLDAELVLLSTRKNGFATKIYPVISDFNYLVAKVNINASYYLLDATEKLNPFGLLPFRCLNSYGRVMDFENASYWLDIVPENNSKSQLFAHLILNKDGSISGKIRHIKYGYDALYRRKKILNKSDDDIILEFENEFNSSEVISYSIKNKTDIDKPTIEDYDFLVENDDNSNNIYLIPFFVERITINPFKQDDRLYPVDFGYFRNSKVNFVLEFPDTYTIEPYLESKLISLEDGKGSFKFNVGKLGNHKIAINSILKINKPLYYNYDYQTLKTLYRHAINIQKTPLVLKKTGS